MNKKVVLLIRVSISAVLLLFFISGKSNAQNSIAQANKLKAVFLFNFTKFIDWPETSFTSAEAPFVIGILGNNPFESYIEQTIGGENVGSHPIVVKYFKDQKEIEDCHILYINFADDKRIKETLASISNRSILTVSETPVFTKLGGMIRIYTERERIRLQINTEAARTAELNISSKLLNVAKTN